MGYQIGQLEPRGSGEGRGTRYSAPTGASPATAINEYMGGRGGVPTGPLQLELAGTGLLMGPFCQGKQGPGWEARSLGLGGASSSQRR